MRTREEIEERKRQLNERYKKKSIGKDSRIMVIGGVRELDWVLGGDE